MNQPTAAVLAAAKRKPSSTPNDASDKLVLLQQTAAEARDIELDIKDLSEQLSEKNKALRKLQYETLPALLEELKIDVIGVPAQGNKPGFDYKMHPYYSANISAKWPEEKRQEGFGLLKKMKAESLIKTEVSAALPKGNLKAAKKLLADIKKLKIPGAKIELSQAVHSGTLAAWLRDIYDGGQSLPDSDLQKIGGSVGRYVKQVEREE